MTHVVYECHKVARELAVVKAEIVVRRDAPISLRDLVSGSLRQVSANGVDRDHPA